jgi:hypothetical protein
VLCCAVLCCAVLCCAVLCCAVLCCAVRLLQQREADRLAEEEVKAAATAGDTPRSDDDREAEIERRSTMMATYVAGQASAPSAGYTHTASCPHSPTVRSWTGRVLGSCSRLFPTIVRVVGSCVRAGCALHVLSRCRAVVVLQVLQSSAQRARTP